jgi:hypothetical protein
MKRSTQIALAGLVLVALAALPSVKRGATLQKGDGVRGACCPLVQSLNEMSLKTSTNKSGFVEATNSHPAIDHP